MRSKVHARLQILATLALIIPLFSPAKANCVSLYDNLVSQNEGVTIISFDGPFANSFSTGGDIFNLGEVKLLLNGEPDHIDPGSSGLLNVGLYSNNNATPGGLLYEIGTLDDHSLSSELKVFEFELASAYTLATNTRYWIVVSDDSGAANWGYSLDQSALGVSGEYHGSFQYGYAPNTSGPFQMSLSGSSGAPVPEPATMILFGTGLAGLAAARRRKKAC